MSLTDPKTRQREINGLLEAMQSYKLSSGIIITEEESGTEVINRPDGISYQINIIPCWQWLMKEN